MDSFRFTFQFALLEFARRFIRISRRTAEVSSIFFSRFGCYVCLMLTRFYVTPDDCPFPGAWQRPCTAIIATNRNHRLWRSRQRPRTTIVTLNTYSRSIYSWSAASLLCQARTYTQGMLREDTDLTYCHCHCHGTRTCWWYVTSRRFDLCLSRSQSRFTWIPVWSRELR